MADAGRRYIQATLESFELHGTDAEQRLQSDVMQSIQRFCDTMPSCVNDGRNAFFIGTVGAGKDHLMIGMLRKLVASGFCSQFTEDPTAAVKWASATEMFGELMDAIGSNSVGEVIARYVRPQLLVISDVLPSNEALKEFPIDCLFRIVDARQRRMKATWVNANVADDADAVAKISAKIVSRLRQDALCLRMTWADYRRTK